MGGAASELERAVDHAVAEVERLGDPALLAAPVRTVLLVHAAQGILDNGGLQFFFESDVPGRPPCALFVDAYCAIGADAEADALAAAVALFPFPDPHRSAAQRNALLDRFAEPATGGHSSGSPFEPLTARLCGNERVWSLLRDFVHRNMASFPPPPSRA